MFLPSPAVYCIKDSEGKQVQYIHDSAELEYGLNNSCLVDIAEGN